MVTETHIPVDRPENQRPIGPTLSALVYSLAPNKANLSRFWPANEGRAKKQSQSKPIDRQTGSKRLPRGRLPCTWDSWCLTLQEDRVL